MPKERSVLRALTPLIVRSSDSAGRPLAHLGCIGARGAREMPHKIRQVIASSVS